MANDEPLEPVKGVRMWIDQDTVHLKAADLGTRDPVELAEHEVEAVITALQSLLACVRRKSAG